MIIIDNESSKKPEEFYTSLKEKLDHTHNFPEDFLFKFIIESSEAKSTEIYSVFDNVKFTLSTRDSSNGKYTSISINALVMDSDQVIRHYKELRKIEGVMML